MASEPMTDERLAELEAWADQTPVYIKGRAKELVAEVRRLQTDLDGALAWRSRAADWEATAHRWLHEREEARNDAKKLANQRDEARAQLTGARRLRILWFNENSAAQAALGRVRALHRPNRRQRPFEPGQYTECANCGGWDYPCATVRALDGGAP